MFKFILGTILGIGAIIAGILAGYFYLISLESGGDIIMLMITLIAFGSGIAIIYRTSKSDALIINKLKKDEVLTEEKDKNFQSLMEKNNQLSRDWNMTVENKDKLKMLEMAEGARGEAEKEAQTH